MKSPTWWITAIACLSILSSPPVVTLAQEPDAGLVEMVLGLLGDEDQDLRALAFEQIRTEAKGESATKQFAAQLPKLPTDGKVGLLRALADRRDAAAKPAVLDVMASSRDPSVLVAAIHALGALGESADCPRLVALLDQGPQAERQAARDSLVQLRGTSVSSAITTEMQSATPFTRIALIEILARRRALDAIPVLLRSACGEDPQVRRAAMTALGQLAGPNKEQLLGMVRGVLKADTSAERADAEKAIMLVCGRIQDKDQRAAPLLAAMRDLDEADRTTMLSTLGRVGGRAAREEVEGAVSSSDGAMHSAGIRALSNWPDASVAPQLIQLAKSDKHPSHQITALRALIRIAPLPDGRTDAEKLELLKRAMAMSTRDEERQLALQRAAAIRLPQTLRFVLPYVDQSAFAKQACETVVELAHDRNLREANRDEFHRALDKVIATSQDATVVDRANRYKKGQTWVRPKR